MDGYSYAKEEADAFGVACSPKVPPRGAFVFYDSWGTIDGTYQNWGHVGLSLGDGRIVHAWGEVRVDHYLKVEELEPGEGWTKAKYLGWAPVSRVLEGFSYKE